MSQMQMSKSTDNLWEKVKFSTLFWTLDHIRSQINQSFFVFFTYMSEIIIEFSVQTQILDGKISPWQAACLIYNWENIMVQN